MITFKNVSITYRADDFVVQNVSAVFATGMCTLLIGQSGVGKTSLLRSVIGLQDYQGIIEINGTPLGTLLSSERAHLVGYVFQEFNLFSTLTVLENCVQPLCVVKKMQREEAIACAQSWLIRLGMEKFFKYMPEELSGGQKQRVALARALCFNPTCLLLDEPTASLDSENTAILQEIIGDACVRGVTVVVASHDTEFVRSVADEVYMIEDRSLSKVCIER